LISNIIIQNLEVTICDFKIEEFSRSQFVTSKKIDTKSKSDPDWPRDEMVSLLCPGTNGQRIIWYHLNFDHLLMQPGSRICLVSKMEKP